MNIKESLKAAYIEGFNKAHRNQHTDAYKAFKEWYKKYLDGLEVHKLIQKNKGRMIRTK